MGIECVVCSAIRPECVVCSAMMPLWDIILDLDQALRHYFILAGCPTTPALSSQFFRSDKHFVCAWWATEPSAVQDHRSRDAGEAV